MTWKERLGEGGCEELGRGEEKLRAASAQLEGTIYKKISSYTENKQFTEDKAYRADCETAW